MTQKEKLYAEYLGIKNQINTLNGNSDKVINLDEFTQGYAFAREAKERKVYQLEDLIKSATAQLAREKKAAQTRAWFETAEGAQFKQEKEAEIAALYAQMEALMQSTAQQVKTMVQTLLGAHFDVIHFGSERMEIGLVKEYKDGNAVAHFGHEFEVYFGKNWKYSWQGDDENFKPYKWELNYGTMGSFDIEDDTLRVQYLVGLAKFASNTTLTAAIRDLVHGFVKTLDTLNKAREDAKAQLEAPKALAA